VRFVFEIPDQLVPAAGAMATNTMSDAISGGAAPAFAAPGTPAPAAISAGEARPPIDESAIADSPDAAINGGPAPDGS
jgi:hypothetical protein